MYLILLPTGFNETVIFAPGEVLIPVSIPIPDDDDYSAEDIEVIVMLTVLTSNPYYCTTSDEATVVIRDNDCK